jgi:putative membrane protein
MAWSLYVLWVLLMMAMPHILRLGGDRALIWGLNASVLCQAATVVAVLWPHWRLPRLLRTVAVVAILAWGVEAIGSSSGVPFGRYSYTERLQPQLFHVPLLIPLAWLMMLAPAWAIARTLTPKNSQLYFALISGLAMAAWDLFLDPQMVAWHLWVWEQPGGYFGIPWVNYAGWILTGMAITWVAHPQDLPILPLILIYTTTWLLESVGLAFYFGLAGPALVGFVVMGLFVVIAWRLAFRI